MDEVKPSFSFLNCQLCNQKRSIAIRTDHPERTVACAHCGAFWRLQKVQGGYPYLQQVVHPTEDDLREVREEVYAQKSRSQLQKSPPPGSEEKGLSAELWLMDKREMTVVDLLELLAQLGYEVSYVYDSAGPILRARRTLES